MWKVPAKGYYSGVFSYILGEALPREGFLYSPVQSGDSVRPTILPESPFSVNVRVTRDYGGPFESEPSIAASPVNPDNLVVAAHQELGYTAIMGPYVVVGIYYTMDGGETWHGPVITKAYDPVNDFILGDPALDAGPDGTFYLAYLSAGYRPLPPPFNYSQAFQSTVMLGVSRDGGETWEFKAAITPDYMNATNLIIQGFYPFTLFIDKEYIAVGKSPLTNDTMIVISYTEFIEGYNYTANDYITNVTIRVAVSHDGGETWLGPFAVSPTITISAAEGPMVPRIVQGSYPAIAPNGTIFVAYYDSLDDGWLNGSAVIMVVRSDDGGRTWSEPVIAAVIPNELTYYYTYKIGETEFPAFRWWSSMFPSIAVADNGTVYIAYTADPDGIGCDPADVYLVVSREWGRTWSQPVRVNDDPEGSCNAQFFPWVEAGPDGSAHIVWADTRLAPARLGFDIYYDRYVNGTLVGNVRVTDYTNPALWVFFVGDYINLAVTERNVHPVWTDTRRSFYFPVDTPLFKMGTSNTDIFTARLGERPRPAVEVSEAEFPAGRAGWVEVTVTGLPREATFAVLLNNFTIDLAMTDSQGRARVSLFLPALREGEYEVTFTGLISYAAYAGFKLKVVDYIAQGISELQGRVGALEDAVNSTAASLLDVKNRVEAIEGRIADISSRLSTLEEGLVRVTQSQASLRDQLASLADKVTMIEEGQKTLASKQDELTAKLESLDSRVTVLEDTASNIASTLGDVSNKLDATKTSIDDLAKRVEEAKTAGSRALTVSAATLVLVIATLAAILFTGRKT
jgi:uncharacterized coiled-coil protein SlyX